jgi:membrane-associated phospholipid phosphatase
MRGRYFFISFLITLLVLPTFAYSQSKTECEKMVETVERAKSTQTPFIIQIPTSNKSNIDYYTTFDSYSSFGQYTASNRPIIIAEDETAKKSQAREDTLKSENSSKQFISREHTIGQDAIDVLKLTGTGFLNQFTNWDSVFLLGATGGMTYMLAQDEINQQETIQNANIIGTDGQKVGDITGLILNIPILQVGGYVLGRATNNEKLTQFAMDVTATHVLALLEVGAISQIPFHKRPNVARGSEAEGSGGVNDIFRGPSSFPSGHMVGVSVLMFKSWEYYGWRAGIPATSATALLGWARIEAGDHYLTDILGTIALSGIASLSTSRKFDIVTRGTTTSDGGRFVVKPVIGTNNWGVSVTRTF